MHRGVGEHGNAKVAFTDCHNEAIRTQSLGNGTAFHRGNDFSKDTSPNTARHEGALLELKPH